MGNWPIIHDNNRYEFVKEIGSGNFRVTPLMRDKMKNEHVAIKYIERGDNIKDNNLKRDVINHRFLKHPNVIRFKEVILTQNHLAIVMKYASGGDLFEYLDKSGHFNEDEVVINSYDFLYYDIYSFIFSTTLCGVNYFHSKLENILLDGSSPPQLKICDFGFFQALPVLNLVLQSSLTDSQPNFIVGTLVYSAPEVHLIADVWSCGVTLYLMLFNIYPFQDLKSTIKTLEHIKKVEYSIPEHIKIFEECRDIISRIFVADPAQHAWFLKNLHVNTIDEKALENQFEQLELQTMQSLEVINQIILEAFEPPSHLDMLGDGIEFSDTACSGDSASSRNTANIYMLLKKM
ncbi:hypothetical protein ACJIZ3_018691 [Penstemon smallii]|uniref:non-specific serine/threonine protein kinase n=1 Tax=Penstemon smallii TaxID=265156 RepID=A0ABD3SZ12_9LAMI